MNPKEADRLIRETGVNNQLSVNGVAEFIQGLYTEAEIKEKILRGKVVMLKGKRESCLVGEGMLIKVNTSVGVSSKSPASYNKEIEKINYLSSVEYCPDIMMDLSIVNTSTPLYGYIINHVGVPTGTLPHYLCFEHKNGINNSQFLKEIEKQASAGVAFMTFHPTPTKDLVEKSMKLRKTPFTSRGGGLVIFDMYSRSKSENIISDLFPEILAILKKYDVAISIGSTFRPANIFDALDSIHKEEFERQGFFIEMAKKAGVPVMFEGVGHMTLDKIVEYSRMIRSYNVLFMPLGPIPTEVGIGMDHISSVIGSVFMARLGAAHIFNTITREEHTGGIPSKESLDEALKSTRIASHIVDISRFFQVSSVDQSIKDKRVENVSCVASGAISKDGIRETGCSRCGYECPLRIAKKLEKKLGEKNERN